MWTLLRSVMSILINFILQRIDNIKKEAQNHNLFYVQSRLDGAHTNETYLLRFWFSIFSYYCYLTFDWFFTTNTFVSCPLFLLLFSQFFIYIPKVYLTSFAFYICILLCVWSIVSTPVLLHNNTRFKFDTSTVLTKRSNTGVAYLLFFKPSI